MIPRTRSRIFTALLVLCLGGVSPSFARLGESEAQSQARYGAPVDGYVDSKEQPVLLGAKQVVYSYEGWRLRVGYLNGVAARIEYLKLPDSTGLKKLTSQEVETVLEAEKGKFTWREIKPRTGYSGLNALQTAIEGRIWKRSDHALATLKHDIVLIVQTRDVDDFEKKMEKQAAKSGGGKPAVPSF